MSPIFYAPKILLFVCLFISLTVSLSMFRNKKQTSFPVVVSTKKERLKLMTLLGEGASLNLGVLYSSDLTAQLVVNVCSRSSKR